MDDESAYRAFACAVLAVNTKFQDLLEQFPICEEIQVPANWPETQELLRRSAEDLMLCKSIDETAHKMLADKSTLPILMWLLTETEDSYFLKVLQRAFELSPKSSEILPGQAYATYLLEMAKGDAPIWRKDRDD